MAYPSTARGDKNQKNILKVNNKTYSLNNSYIHGNYEFDPETILYPKNGNVVVLASNSFSAGTEGMFASTFEAEFVDLTQSGSTSTLLIQYKGMGAIDFGTDGALYIQVGEKTRRYQQPFSPEQWTSIINRVYLIPHSLSPDPY